MGGCINAERFIITISCDPRNNFTLVSKMAFDLGWDRTLICLAGRAFHIPCALLSLVAQPQVHQRGQERAPQGRLTDW